MHLAKCYLDLSMLHETGPWPGNLHNPWLGTWIYLDEVNRRIGYMINSYDQSVAEVYIMIWINDILETVQDLNTDFAHSPRIYLAFILPNIIENSSWFCPIFCSSYTFFVLRLIVLDVVFGNLHCDYWLGTFLLVIRWHTNVCFDAYIGSNLFSSVWRGSVNGHCYRKLKHIWSIRKLLYPSEVPTLQGHYT